MPHEWVATKYDAYYDWKHAKRLEISKKLMAILGQRVDANGNKTGGTPTHWLQYLIWYML